MPDENTQKSILLGFDPDWFYRCRDVDGTEVTDLRISRQFIEATELDIIQLDMALAEIGLRPDMMWSEGYPDSEHIQWNRLLSDEECGMAVRGVEVCLAR